MLLRSLFRAVQDGDDADGTRERQRGSQTNGQEPSLLEVIRVLLDMVPQERTALVKLLKALG